MLRAVAFSGSFLPQPMRQRGAGRTQRRRELPRNTILRTIFLQTLDSMGFLLHGSTLSEPANWTILPVSPDQWLAPHRTSFGGASSRSLATSISIVAPESTAARLAGSTMADHTPAWLGSRWTAECVAPSPQGMTFKSRRYREYSPEGYAFDPLFTQNNIENSSLRGYSPRRAIHAKVCRHSAFNARACRCAPASTSRCSSVHYCANRFSMQAISACSATLDLPGVHHFGNYGSPVSREHFAQNPQSLEAKSLKIVCRRSRWLKCAAAESALSRTPRLPPRGHCQYCSKLSTEQRTRPIPPPARPAPGATKTLKTEHTPAAGPDSSRMSPNS